MRSTIDHCPKPRPGNWPTWSRSFVPASRPPPRRTQARFRGGKLLKIILFGSYARGDWVEDPVGRYFSDYDLLVVVDREELTDVAEFWDKTESRLLSDLTVGTVLRTPVSLIYHALDDVNDKLRLGRYFFMDILKDGIVLFEEPGHAFVEPLPLSRKKLCARRRSISTNGTSARRRLEIATEDLAKGATSKKLP
jgi:predicted nucleotidyltransferase